MDHGRFFSKVKKSNGCWLWTGSLNDGYGRFRFENVIKLAHRFSWEIHKGKIPAGMNVLHRCDVRNCVNPEHLFIGSHLDNAIDCINKGRRGRKLNSSTVKMILADPISSHYALGKKFGVDASLVRRIRRREAWKIIP